MLNIYAPDEPYYTRYVDDGKFCDLKKKKKKKKSIRRFEKYE